MAGVDDVETPVAVHDRTAFAPGGFADGEEVSQGADLARGGHGCRVLSDIGGK